MATKNFKHLQAALAEKPDYDKRAVAAEHAVLEEIRTYDRSNQRQFPCWGDSGPDEPAIILGDEAETYGAWTPREASAELPDYDDIDDIYNPDFWG